VGGVMPTQEPVDEVVQPAVGTVGRSTSSKRFLPLDAFRGLIILILVSDGFGFAVWNRHWPANHPIYHLIGQQFEHVDWIGTHFWDLIAPCFLFMVGMSMSYSVFSRAEQGVCFQENFKRVGRRFLGLMVLSQVIISIEENRLHFQMHNILTHIAVACVACFLIMQLDFKWQIVSAAALLAIHTLPFFLFPSPGGPFTKTGNIAAVWDRAIMGGNYASWTTNWNMVSTIVTALFGVWVGNLLRSSLPRPKQMKILGVAMVVGWVVGLALMPIIPSLRRIWTASFVFWSAGWAILILLVLYFLIEVSGHKGIVFPLSVAGANTIFIYTLGEILRGWIDKSVAVFTGRFWFLGPFSPVAQACAVLGVMWYLCYWLYKRKIFLRL
jgi:heparan-alpha-glucosaminide N-acetyltransferase